MRTILPVCGGSDAGEPRSLRSRVGRMKRLLWLRQSQCMGVHMNTEPGVWLRSFQFLDTDGQCEVSLEFCSNVEKRLVCHAQLYATVWCYSWCTVNNCVLHFNLNSSGEPPGSQ